MSSFGIRRSRSTDSRVADSILDEDRIQIENEKIFKETGDASTGSSTGIANLATAAGNFLAKAGDIREGPMGNQLGIVEIINDEIDVSLGSQNYFPILVLNGEGGADDALTRIVPGSGVFLNQELIVQAGSFTITIQETGGGNILTPGTLAFNLLPGEYAKLIFSVVAGNKWVVTWFSGNTGGGGGISFPIDFPEDDRETVGASTQEILFTDSDRHSVKMIIEGDIELAFSSPPTNETAYTNIIIVQDNVGGHTLTLPSGTVNKDIVEAGFLTGADLETGIVIKFAFGVFYAFLETGNRVSGGGTPFSGNLSDLVIDVNKDWLAQGISNFGALTGVTGIDMDGVTATIQGVKLIDFIQTGQTIDSVAAGLDYFVDPLQRHEFKTFNGSFLAMQEVNPTDRRLDVKQNRVTNIGKLRFSPTFDIDTAGTAEIYETLTLGNLRYVSNNAHVFVQEGVPTLLSIGNFAGNGGLVQDIALLNFNSLTGEFLFNNGDFQLDGIDMKVLSNNKIINLSDIATLTTKGDLFGFDTVNARIPVGSDGQVLTANSATSLGVEWAVGSPSNEIVSGDSKIQVVDAGTGVIGFDIDSSTIITIDINEALYGIRIDMDGNDIQNPNKILLANGLSIENTDTENTEIIIPPTDFLKIIEGTDIRLQIDKNIILNSDTNDSIIFQGNGVEVGRYNDDTKNWVFNPANDVKLSPATDIDLTPQNDIIMNPAGEIKAFKDLDMDGNNTIDFGTSTSTPVGSAIGGIQVKINGIVRLVKFYSV